MDFITDIYKLIAKFIYDLLVKCGIDEERIPEEFKKSFAEDAE